MSNRSIYFESVETIWIIWALCVPVIVAMVIRSCSRIRWADLKALHREEDGAAYSLAFVMTVPFYTYFVCLVVEMTLILICKLGSVHAAYAVARNQIVIRSLSGDQRDCEERAKMVAARAMTAFASDNALHLNAWDQISGVVGSGFAIPAYIGAAKLYYPDIDNNASYTQLYRKGQYAWKATSVEIPSVHIKDADNNGGFIECRVIYKYPFKVPFIGRILGERNFLGTILGYDNHYYFQLETAVALPDEWPEYYFPASQANRAPRGITGIRYDLPQQ